MKLIFFQFLFFACTLSHAFAQNDSMRIIDTWKDGNNSFQMNIKIMQSYLVTPHTVKHLERSLGHYERQSFDSISFIDGNKEMTIMPYTIKYKDDSFEMLYVGYEKRTKIIKSFRFELIENQARVEKLNNFLSLLNSLGYKKDIAYTRIVSALERRAINPPTNKKWYFYNPVGHLNIEIYTKEEDLRYSIRISK